MSGTDRCRCLFEMRVSGGSAGTRRAERHGGQGVEAGASAPTTIRSPRARSSPATTCPISPAPDARDGRSRGDVQLPLAPRLQPQAQLRNRQARPGEHACDTEPARLRPALGRGLPQRLVAAEPGQGRHPAPLLREAACAGRKCPLLYWSALLETMLAGVSCWPSRPEPACLRCAHRRAPAGAGTSGVPRRVGKPTPDHGERPARTCRLSRATWIAPHRPPMASANARRGLYTLARHPSSLLCELLSGARRTLVVSSCIG